MRYLITLLAVFLLGGWTIYGTNHFAATVASWKGQSVKNLYRTWGSPDGIMQGDNGNSIYVYKTTSYRQSYSPPSVGVNTAGGRPVIVVPTNMGRSGFTYECTTLFEVNKQNIIVRVSYQGNGCFGSEGFAHRMAWR